MDPKETAFRIDLHVHGKWSKDAIGDLDALAQAATRKGLAGLVLTEHNTTRHHDAVREWNRDHQGSAFVLFPGIEVSTKNGHLLAIGVREAITARQEPEETIEAVTAAGGVAVPAHPHRRFTGIGPHRLADVAPRIHAVETHNAQETRKSGARTLDLAAALGLAGTGGSDAHQVHDVGNACTVFPEPVQDLDALLDQLRRGRIRGEGGRTRFITRARQRARIALRLATFRYP